MPLRNRYRTLSLSSQVLLPFVLLVLLLALASAYGSSQLLRTWLFETSAARLEKVQEQAFHIFKHQENLLHQHSLEARLKYPAPPDELLQLLRVHDRKTSLRIAAPGDPQLPLPLRDLASRAGERANPLISIVQSSPQNYAMVACLKLPTGDYLFLEHPLDAAYLDSLAEHLLCEYYLLGPAGEVIATSSQAPQPLPQLSGAQLTRLHAGTPLSITTGTERRQFSFTPLPLGAEGVFLLAATLPDAEANSLLQNHLHYQLASIGLILLLGIAIYRGLLQRIFRPLDQLLELGRSILRGDYTRRSTLSLAGRSRFSPLGSSLNQLLDERATTREELDKLNSDLQATDEIRVHNDHLRKANLELEKRCVALKEQNQEHSALLQATQTMVSSLDQQILFERIIQILRSSLKCSQSLLFLYQPGIERLDAVKGHGFQGTELKSIQISLGQQLVGEAAINQKLVYCSDLALNDDGQHFGSHSFTTGSLLAIPLLIQNRLTGVICLRHTEPNAFGSTAQQIAQAIANQAAIALENARLFEKTKTLSSVDELTGLTNRRQFQDYLHRELAQARRFNNSFSLLLVDIDQFRAFNDWHGHLKGDALLRRLAGLLQQNIRGIDLVARFGGEEFIVLLPKTDKKTSLMVADKLRLCIERESFPGAEKSQPGQRLTISIGAASFPVDSTDIYELMNLADEALYQAKKQGRNRSIGWSESFSPQTEKEISSS